MLRFYPLLFDKRIAIGDGLHKLLLLQLLSREGRHFAFFYLELVPQRGCFFGQLLICFTNFLQLLAGRLHFSIQRRDVSHNLLGFFFGFCDFFLEFLDLRVGCGNVGLILHHYFLVLRKVFFHVFQFVFFSYFAVMLLFHLGILHARRVS